METSCFRFVGCLEVRLCLLARLNYIVGLLDFHSSFKSAICCSFKTLAFCIWLIAKLMPNSLVQAMPWQCMFAYYISILKLYVFTSG
jgi:hypothetical protein